MFQNNKIKLGAVIAVILALGFIGACSDQSSKKAKIKRLEKISMPEFVEPEVKSGVLSNGMHYYLLPDHQIPIVRLGVITKVGSIYDPSGKVGLANLVGATMRSGGTKKMTPEEVDILLDDFAAEASSSISREMGAASLKVLSEDLDTIMPVFFDIMFEPRFDAQRVKLNKIKLIEALRREEDFPDKVAEREFSQLVYGKDSPWARKPTEKSVNDITADDLQKFHSAYFVPQNMILAASGDFDPDRLLARIETLLSQLPKREVILPDVAPVKLEFDEKEKFIKKPLTQAYVEMGHLGIKRHNPDKYALEIMNMILGAPLFKSRLMEDIRTNRGMAYSIGSQFGWGTDYGLFEITVDTKAENVDEVVKLIEEHLKRMKDKGDVTGDELDFAKKTVLNRLIFLFDNPHKIVTERARYDFFGYPPNYWHIYKDGIERVKVDDVKRVSSDYLHPEGLSIVVVGPEYKK